MGNVIFRNCVNKIKHVCKEHPYKISFLCSIIIVLLMILLGQIYWEGSDDFTISQLLMGTCGESTPYVQVCQYYLGVLIVWLQHTLPYLNWFAGLEVGSVFVFFGVATGFILKNANGKNSIIALVFPLIFEPLFLQNLQYTRTSFILCFSGLLLLFDAIIGELPSPRILISPIAPAAPNSNESVRGGHSLIGRIFKILAGVITYIWGTLFRYATGYIAVCYVLILVAIGLLYYLKHRTEKLVLKRIIACIGAIAALLIVSQLLYNQNLAIYSEWDETTDFRAYNRARSNVTDYMNPTYSEDLLSGNPQISENDWYMIKCSVINDSFFSIDYFEQVKEVFQKYGSNISSGSEFNIKQVAFFRSGHAVGTRAQLFTTLILCIIALLLSQEIYLIAVGADILGTVVIILYFLNGNRLPPWVVDPIYVFASVIALICISVSFDTNKNKGTFGNLKKYICYIALAVCLCLNFQEASEVSKRDSSSTELEELLKYAEEHDETTYLIDSGHQAPYPYIDTVGALTYFEEGQWENIIRVGNWDVEHPSRNAQKEKRGIDSVLYSMVEGKSELIAYKDNNFIDVYKTFFSEHYGVDVEFECVEDFGEYGIFAVRE